MLPNYLKCLTNTESKNPKVVKTKNGRNHEIVKCEIIKYQNLSKSKKLVDY